MTGWMAVVLAVVALAGLLLLAVVVRLRSLGVWDGPDELLPGHRCPRCLWWVPEGRARCPRCGRRTDDER